MHNNTSETQRRTEEQLTYAKILNIFRIIGLWMLVLTFIVYVFGIIPPMIALEEVSQYWGLSVNDYLARTDIQTGWAWLRMIKYGDIINFLPIAFLSFITIICYLVIMPIFFKKKDKVYTWIALIQILVLVLAASGILKGGGH